MSDEITKKVKEASQKKRSLILLAVLLLFSAEMFLLTGYFAAKGEMVVVTVDGKNVKEIPLSENTEYKIEGTVPSELHVDGNNTEYNVNVIVIKDGKCHMESANCPDKLCVEQGEISKEGEAIICLPHRVVITIEGKEELGYGSI